MLVKMRMDYDDSLNRGRTIQRFDSGKTYDVPEEIASGWLAAGIAMNSEESGVRSELSGAEDGTPHPSPLTPRGRTRKSEEV